MSAWTEHVFYEHEFQPDEARKITERTREAGYNFRESGSELGHVQKLAHALRTGRFRWRDQAFIRLSSDRRLCSDGMHRLLACAVSGIPLRAPVLVGDEWAAGIETDHHKARTMAQYMQSKGLPNAKTWAAVVASHMARSKAVAGNVSYGHARGVLLHAEEMIAFSAEHEELLTWVTGRVHVAADRGMNQTGYGVMLLELGFMSRDLASEFHTDFQALDLDPDDPLLRLRIYAMARFAETGKRMNQTWTINNLIKAHNYRRSGESLKLWKQVQSQDVTFPAGFRGT